MSQRYLGGVITANPTTPTLASLSGVWTLEQQFQNFNVWSPEIVGNSVRFRSSASGNFSRTYGATGNQQQWTWSCWVKRGKLSDSTGGQTLFSGLNGLSAGNSRCRLTFESDDTLNLALTNMNTAEVAGYRTAALFRDPSAWYHVVVAIETANPTAGDRVKLYVNGTRYTTSGTTAALNANMPFGVNAVPTYIGSYYNPSSGTAYFDGYLAEINFIDGQALTPSSFGALDSTGVWQPLPYTGTYGTNGFYLTFSDNSAATAAALGKDTSGNGNNWTPNNISLTAGVTYDWMLDSPTNWTNGTGNGVANYAVMNPLTTRSGYSSATDGNLRANFTSGANASFVIGNTFQSSGKWYCEAQIVSTGADATRPCVGIVRSSFDWYSIAINLGDTSDSWAYLKNGNKRTASTTSSYGSSYTAGDIIGIALDMDAGTVVFYKNNVSQGTAFTGLSGDIALATSGYADGATRAIDVNFGQRPFSYTPPTGFKALNTLNLPDPTIMNGAQYMAATLWTGNGTSQTISNAVNSVSMQPDLVWVKDRSVARNNNLLDSVRGPTKGLFSNLTSAEVTSCYLSSFNSNGFTVGNDVSTNGSGETFVGWQWQAGKGTTSSNTNGSITSTTSVSTTAGFSVVTYTGNGTSGATIGHGLGVTPKMYILKRRDAGGYNWIVQTTIIDGSLDYLFLNTTAAKGDSGDTPPTSSVISVSGNADVNASGGTYVAYCFAPVSGYSAFGTYTGNGSSSGPFVYLGFRPRWILIKRSDTSGTSWCLVDSSRSPNNTSVNGGMQNTLFPNVSNAEDTGADICDGLSNGFRFYQGASSFNANGGTYIYACFAENPFKIARAR